MRRKEGLEEKGRFGAERKKEGRECVCEYECEYVSEYVCEYVWWGEYERERSWRIDIGLVWFGRFIIYFSSIPLKLEPV